jgi:hypothetical protein
VNVSPVLRIPESQRPGVALTELWKLDIHTHITWSLTLIVTLSGSNENPRTLTFVVLARAARATNAISMIAMNV